MSLSDAYSLLKRVCVRHSWSIGTTMLIDRHVKNSLMEAARPGLHRTNSAPRLCAKPLVEESPDTLRSKNWATYLLSNINVLFSYLLKWIYFHTVNNKWLSGLSRDMIPALLWVQEVQGLNLSWALPSLDSFFSLLPLTSHNNKFSNIYQFSVYHLEIHT